MFNSFDVENRVNPVEVHPACTILSLRPAVGDFANTYDLLSPFVGDDAYIVPTG